MRYAIIEDGKIMGFREIPEEDIEIIAHYRKTETLVEAGDEIQSDTHYISGTTPTLRPSFSLSLSKSTMTAGDTDYINLVGVPSGATVTLSRVGASKTVTADGTTIQIKTPLPGEYTVTVEKFPYRNGVVNFVATAST